MTVNQAKPDIKQIEIGKVIAASRSASGQVVNFAYLNPPQYRTLLFKNKTSLYINIPLYSVMVFCFRVTPKKLVLAKQFFGVCKERPENLDAEIYVSNLPAYGDGGFGLDFCLGDLRRDFPKDESVVKSMVSMFWQSKFYDCDRLEPTSLCYTNRVLSVDKMYKLNGAILKNLIYSDFSYEYTTNE